MAASFRAAALILAVAVAAVACTSGEQEAGPAVVQAESLNAAGDSTGESLVVGDSEDVESGDGDAVASDEPDGDSTAPDDSAGDSAAGLSAAESTAEVGAILNETGQNLNGAELEEYLARRYEAYWYAFDIARRAPTADPATDYPALNNLAAGEQLETAYRELDTLFTAGQAIRDPDVPAVEGLDENTAHRVRIEMLEEGVAELVACLVNDQVTYNVADGSVVSESIRTVQAQATMAKADGTWKLIRSRASGLEAGVAGCWLDDPADYPY